MNRLLAFYLLFHGLSAVLAQLQVQLNFYTDHQCQTPSTEHAAVSIPISECIVTPGLGSISHPSVNCENGDVQLVAYQDTSCGTQLGVLDWYKVTKQCSARYSGGIAAILLTCNQVSGAGTIDPGTPTTTSTVVVAQVAGSAPTATHSVASSSLSVTHSGRITTTQTASSSSPSSSNNGGDIGTNNSTGGNSTSSSKSSSGLSTSDIISIAVGLGVGIPTILIGLWGLRRRRRNKLNQETETRTEMSSKMYPLSDVE
ncbi:hypothetical protein MMC22_011673 [Lobaria immixta]|nr:hypothetical protein [Lobaria immixta]